MNRIGRRLRQACNDRERLRKAVGNAIRRAVKDIAKYDSQLAAHLSTPTLRLGFHPLYAPAEEIDWAT